MAAQVAGQTAADSTAGNSTAVAVCTGGTCTDPQPRLGTEMILYRGDDVAVNDLLSFESLTLYAVGESSTES